MAGQALSTEVKVTLHKAATVAGTSAINGATLDMTGWDGVMFFTTFGAITTGAVTSIKAQQGAAANASDMADLAGTGLTVDDDDDGESFFIDLVRPAKQYVRAVVSRGTQNAVVGEIYAVQYRGRSAPVVNAVAATMTGVVKYDPTEGTP